MRERLVLEAEGLVLKTTGLGLGFMVDSIKRKVHTHTHIYISNTLKHGLYYGDRVGKQLECIFNSRHKCTFSSYILTFFHFGPYILILPLLVPKPINTCYFCPFRQSTDGNS